jgi:DNA-directed RNA polymerase beta' subunit
MGHIKLYTPVSHIWFLRGVPSRMGLVLNKSSQQLEKVVYFSSYIVTKVDEKARDTIMEAIEDEYKAKLSLLRNYYANGVRNPGSGPVPTNPFAPIGADPITSYNVLAGQCAETTLMLVELQKWLKEQVGIK